MINGEGSEPKINLICNFRFFSLLFCTSPPLISDEGQVLLMAFKQKIWKILPFCLLPSMEMHCDRKWCACHVFYPLNHQRPHRMHAVGTHYTFHVICATAWVYWSVSYGVTSVNITTTTILSVFIAGWRSSSYPYDSGVKWLCRRDDCISCIAILFVNALMPCRVVVFSQIVSVQFKFFFKRHSLSFAILNVNTVKQLCDSKWISVIGTRIIRI